MVEERLKEIREQFCLTQQEFAACLGVSRTAYAKYESGLVYPSDTFIFLLCSKFHVNREWLCNGNGDMLRETKMDILQRLKKEEIMTEDEVLLLRAFLAFPLSSRQEILKFIKEFFAKYRGLLGESANKAENLPEEVKQ